MQNFRIPFEKLDNVRRVGIQLPDGLKRYAVEIANELEERGFDVIISGETSYGACDVDLSILNEVDVLLHFAHTPISTLNIGRVIYVPYFIDYDPRIEAEIPEKRITLISTAQYVHKLKEVADWLKKRGYEVEIGKGSGRVHYPGQVLGCNYSAVKKTKADAIVFIGDGLFHAIGAAIYTKKRVYAYNPLSKAFQEVNADNFIKKRYFTVSKCVGKGKVGIIVSSKPGQRRMGLARRLKEEASKGGLKAHIIFLNNLRAEELLNLPYDYYVNTACPRISYDDAERFERPVITPQEFEFLMGKREDIGIDEINE